LGIPGKLKAFFDDKNLTELKTQPENEQARLLLDIEFSVCLFHSLMAFTVEHWYNKKND